MAEKSIGKITQVISAVLDIKFSQGKLPKINGNRKNCTNSRACH